MLINPRVAEYLAKAVSVLPKYLEIGGGSLKEYITDRCPECGCPQTSLDNMDHVVFPITFGNGKSMAIVLIGCEGFMVLNPRYIGMHPGQWQDWTADPNSKAHGAPTHDIWTA